LFEFIAVSNRMTIFVMKRKIEIDFIDKTV